MRTLDLDEKQTLEIKRRLEENALPENRVYAYRHYLDNCCTRIRDLLDDVLDGAIAAGGEVIGIIPKFMVDLEWGHPGVTTLELVEDMRERKHRLLTGSDAVIALPGGCGTLEELFEAITLKRLGLYFSPIVLLSVNGFYDGLQAFMQKVIDERFMNPEHAAMWSMVARVDEVLPRIRETPRWSENARDYAVVR